MTARGTTVRSGAAMTDHGDETIDADPESIEELKRQALERAPGSNKPVDRPRADPEANAARDFVEAARVRDAEVRAAEQAAAEPASTRRSTWVIGLAVLVAAQILAGGVYFALRALQDDPVEIVEVTEPEVVATPTPSPTIEPTATPPATPTPVPPTPTWLPVQNGPRSAPFTFIATVAEDALPLFDEPSGAEVFLADDGEQMPGQWASGAPVRLRVVSGIPSDEWVQVALPGAGERTAWVESDDVTWTSTNRILQIDVMDNQARVFEGNSLIFQASIATGDRSSPTPQLQSWILENPAGERIEGAAPMITFADDLGAGDGPLTILPINDDRVVGEYVTGGEILLATDEAEQLAIILSAGSKVEVVGTPARPTPTPTPTPTRGPVGTDDRVTGPSEPLDTRCPGGAQGVPPNCYRVVERESVPAPCPGRQIVIENRCMILAGNPERIDNSVRCPDTASRFIGNLCYTDVSPIPEAPGDCPANANEVAGECRVAA